MSEREHDTIHASPASRGAATLRQSLILAGSLAAVITLMATSDLENYDHSFISLDRGTAFETVKVLGRPVFTLALGLGVRLPLHGGLQSSPAAWLAPYVPEPITYWLLLTLAIGSAAFLARHALEPLCGRVIATGATWLLFWSLPIVNYTVTDDWPETAMTYCAFVACVFAPHALVEIRCGPSDAKRRAIASLSILALLWGLLEISHPGYWPLLAIALLMNAVLVAIRTERPLRSRLAIIAVVGCVSCVAIAAIAPDVIREMVVAGDALATMKRTDRGPEGGSFWSANSPFTLHGSARRNFTFFAMTVSALGIGLGSESATRRRLALGSGIAACACGMAAATLSTGGFRLAPSVLWALRDPAIGFAVLSAACAAGTLQANRLVRAIGLTTTAVLLALTALQGPIVATATAFQEWNRHDLFDGWVAPRGTMRPNMRMSRRGLPADRVVKGSRIALWPEVARTMRNHKAAQADFVDAGYVLLTATTKQRTMARLSQPNDILFEQAISLPPDILCSEPAVQFLQLEYLLAPAPVACDVWTPVNPPLVVDEWLTVYAAATPDRQVRILPAQALSDALRREPALSSRSSLLSALSPLRGSALSIGPRDVVIHQDDPAAASGLTFVLPLAFDSAWTTSNGRIHEVAGLVALAGTDQRDVVLRFVPDGVAVLRSVATIVAQIFVCCGLIGLALVAPNTVRADTRLDLVSDRVLRRLGRAAMSIVGRLVPGLDLLQVLYAAILVVNLDWQPTYVGGTGLLVALLLPASALVITRLGRRSSTCGWIGGGLLSAAILWTLVKGSVAVNAIDDPLFWVIVAAVGLALAFVTRRRPLVSAVASATAAATATLAILLPLATNFASAFPRADPHRIRELFTAFFIHLGPAATIALVVLAVCVIASHLNRWRTWGPTAVGARAALITGAVLSLAGAAPSSLGPLWMVTAGVLMGLADVDSRARIQHESREPRQSAASP